MPEAHNVVAHGDVAYAALGADGLSIVDLAAGRSLGRCPPPDGASGVHDVSFSEDLVFALDANRPGSVFSYALASPDKPWPACKPVAVDTGPFSGLAAATGRVVVSGGTGKMTVLTYTSVGHFGATPAKADLGIGQPDVVLAHGGAVAFASTDFREAVDGARFGITVLAIHEPPEAPEILARIGVRGAGFTPGIHRPATFPLHCLLKGHLLYVAHGGGLLALDVSRPAASHVVQEVKLGFHPLGVDGDETGLYVVGSHPSPTLARLRIHEGGLLALDDEVPLRRASRPARVAVGSLRMAIADLDRGVLIEDR